MSCLCHFAYHRILNYSFKTFTGSVDIIVCQALFELPPGDELYYTSLEYVSVSIFVLTFKKDLNAGML